MSPLGERNPEVAGRLSLDPTDFGHDVGRLAIVTFREPQHGAGTRRDPVAYLPPTYDRFGIVDRDHRDLVKAGETWVTRPYTTGTGAVFLIPVRQVELSDILALDRAHVEQMAQELARHRPDLVNALRDFLPGQAPKVNEAEVLELRAKLERAQEALRDVRNAVVHASRDWPALLLQAQARIDSELPAVKPATLELKKAKPVWLADSNLFINAVRWKNDECNRIIDSAGIRFTLAVTRQVHDELVHNYRLPSEIQVIDVPNVDQALRELASANAHALGKKASTTDISLVQALLDHPEIRGIITDDLDIRNMHPESILRKLQNRPAECVTAKEFLANHRKLVVGDPI